MKSILLKSLCFTEGDICAELIYPYPPGIPLIIPGERIDRDRLDWLIQLKNIFWETIPDTIRIVDEVA